MSLVAHIAVNLLSAWAAGSLIGLERSYNGRVAGFRTHGLVSLAAATTISIAYAPQFWPGSWPNDHGWLEPMALGQGVVTGVGFLGAGVIFKEGVSIQGLTTAASIWATAAIGLVLGLGLYGPGALATVAVVISLALLSQVETRMPSRIFGVATIRFRAVEAPSEAALKAMLDEDRVSLEDMSYRLTDKGEVFEFQGSVATSRRAGFGALAERLKREPGLIEFDLMRVSK